MCVQFFFASPSLFLFHLLVNRDQSGSNSHLPLFNISVCVLLSFCFLFFLYLLRCVFAGLNRGKCQEANEKHTSRLGRVKEISVVVGFFFLSLPLFTPIFPVI